MRTSEQPPSATRADLHFHPTADLPRVALVADDAEELRRRGVPGFEVEVLERDANVALAHGGYDLLHLGGAGPTHRAATVMARKLGLPIVGSYDVARTDLALAAVYGECALVLSPSASTDARLEALGIPAERIARWNRGADAGRFSPGRFTPGLLDRRRINVLAGRPTGDEEVQLLAEAFTEGHRLRPALQLVIGGGGPAKAVLRERLGDAVTCLGRLEGDGLAAAYASADLFVSCSKTDSSGPELLDAQAAGLPVVAVAGGGAAEVVAHGRSGLLCRPEPALIGLTLAGLAGSPSARRRLAGGGLDAARERSWQAALANLAEAWRIALSADRGTATRAA